MDMFYNETCSIGTLSAWTINKYFTESDYLLLKIQLRDIMSRSCIFNNNGPKQCHEQPQLRKFLEQTVSFSEIKHCSQFVVSW